MSMFTHVMVGTNDREKSRAFYDAVFATLGISGQSTERADWYGSPETRSAAFGVVIPRNDEPATFANGGTIGFKAESAAQVDAWYAAGMANGGSDEGPPGHRHYSDSIYVAYLRDPDGNKLCAVYTPAGPDAQP